MNEVNIILDVLKEMVKSEPSSVFINSLYHQYCNRGGLSKKQLEGLYGRAVKISGINPAKLATLEAIIKKKPTRERTPPRLQPVPEVKDKAIGSLLEAILAKYPAHKRLLFLRSKYDHNDPLSVGEIAEIQKFRKLLLK